MRHRYFLRLLLTSLLSLSVLLTWTWIPFFSQAPAALAHAFVIGSDPVDGSTIGTAPTMIRIFFNADISPASTAYVYAFAPGGPSDGREVDGGRSTIPPNNARELDTPLLSPATLPQGSYEVKWTAIATGDGHATHGLIGFNVGYSVTGLSGTPTLGPTTSNILPQLNLQGTLAVMWEWLTSLALTVWVGIVIMEGLFLLGMASSPDATDSETIASLKKSSRPLQWLCLAALLVGEIINLILRGALLTQELRLPGIDLIALRQLLLETSYGHFWLIRVGLICLALLFLWWTTRGQAREGALNRPSRAVGKSRNRFSQLRQQVAAATGEQSATQENTSKQDSEPARAGALNRTPTAGYKEKASALNRTSTSRWHAITWLTLAALILLTVAFSGEAAQLAQQHSSAVALNWLHLLAQSAWFGGAAYLGFVLLPQLPTIASEHRSELLVNVLRSFMPLLLAALGVLLVSGLFLTETTISDAQQWLNDPYGRALLVKVLLLALMLIFTSYSFLYLVPQLRRQVVLLPVVNADLPARRSRRSALEQTEGNLKRVMHILAVLGAAVLLCAALMTFLAPPIVFPALAAANAGVINQAPTTGVANAPVVQTRQIGNLSVSLEVLPAQVDTGHAVIITLKDSTGNAISDAHVQITTNMVLMDMGTAREDLNAQGGRSTYVAFFAQNEAFLMPGLWNINLVIQRPNQAPLQVQFVFTLTG